MSRGSQQNGGVSLYDGAFVDGALVITRMGAKGEIGEVVRCQSLDCDRSDYT